jgi:hypothetical protein
MRDLLIQISRKYLKEIWCLCLAGHGCVVATFCFIAHRMPPPCGRISIFFGLIEYTKAGCHQGSGANDTGTQDFVLTRDVLAGRSWEFLHGEGDVIAPAVRLDPSGAIKGVDPPNESRRDLENHMLVFFHQSGVPSTRFTEMRREAGKIIRSGGRLLPSDQPVVLHLL